MFFFNKNKKAENTAPVQPSQPSPVKSAPRPIVDADDFFKDMGRKPKPKTVSFEIETPEVTGLREAPLPPPGSTINNLATDEHMTDGLADKTLEITENLGNIKIIDSTYDNIDAVLPDKNFVTPDEDEIYAQEIGRKPKIKNSDPMSADSFFADIDRRRNRRPSADIDVPEVTGLREEPEAAPQSLLAEAVADEAAAEQLADKTLYDDSFIHGDISGIDLSNIDTDSLGSKI